MIPFGTSDSQLGNHADLRSSENPHVPLALGRTVLSRLRIVKDWSMSRSELVEVTLPDGDVIWVELDVPSGADIAWRGKQKLTWDDLRMQVLKITKLVAESVKSALPDRPTRLGLEFGIKLTAETGPLVAALAKAGAEASVVVRLDWEGERVPQEP